MQITLREQLVKIIKQFFGRENIFGYETTLANQLFLYYCFCGKFYFTRKINNSFRFIWMLYNLSCLLVTYVLVGAFLIHDKEPDISTQLFMINVMVNSTLMGFFIPVITFLYRDDIEQCIRDIDRILQNRSSHQEEKLDLWKYVNSYIVIQLISGTVWGNVCLCDVLIFYEEEKVKNYTYYLFPFPNTELIGTLTIFQINTTLSNFILSSQAFAGLSSVAIILLWGVICKALLNKASKKLDYRLIESLRKLYQLFCSLSVPVSIIGLIVQLHTIVSTNLPWAVKIKGIGMMVAVAHCILQICWIGETLENSLSLVSFSVYSTPWYWSKNFRQNTYLFLCQTQHGLNFTAIKVYPMLLRTYSRFGNFVQSTVNFLHQLSQ